MELYLDLAGIHRHKNKLELLQHLEYVTEQLVVLHNSLGLELTPLNDDNNNLIDNIENKYNVSFGKVALKIEDCYRAISEEIKSTKDNT